MKTLNTLTALAMACVCAIGASAHDFYVMQDGQKLYFNVTDRTARTAELTYRGTSDSDHDCTLTGNIEIPSQVADGGVTYTVTSIGAKAFSGADKLTGVVLPPTVSKIGDNAFEECTRLTSVVFPGQQIDLNESTFAGDKALRHISLGSDWRTLDLKVFRSSDSLQSIFIPARIDKIKNLKAVKSLRYVVVDPNNRKFSSIDGILYNKDGDVLYGVPRSYAGTVKVAEGTTSITKGALIDCPDVTAIDFPTTLKYVSFREFSQMPNLKEIVFRSESVPVTAYVPETHAEALALQLENPSVTIIVPNAAKNAYTEALVVTPADFCEDAQDGARTYRIGSNQVPSKKKIKAVKKFD